MKKLIRILVAIVPFVFRQALFAQNLVPNPMFETYSACPDSWTKGCCPLYNAIALATPWNHTGFDSGPDYFNACDATAVAGAPVNFIGNQTALSGDGYAGFFTFAMPSGSNYREYIQVQLTTPLTGGVTYNVTMYVSLADEAYRGTNRIGAYFSSTAPANSSPVPLSFTPQVEGMAVITDKTGWTMISGSFVAAAGPGQRYMTIGNFRTDALTTVVTTGAGTNGGAYYYIEDICVTPQGGSGCLALPVELISFTGRNENNKNVLEWKTSGENANGSFDVERSINGNDFPATGGSASGWETIGRVQGAGNSTAERNYYFIDESSHNGINYYRLKQTDYDGKFTYSQTIAVKDQSNVSTVKISPDPANDNIILEAVGNKNLEIVICDVLGRKAVKHQISNVGAGSAIDISMLPKGMYFLKVMSGAGETQLKFIK